jgi:hypothetical protein
LTIAMICSSVNLLRFICPVSMGAGCYFRMATFQGCTSPPTTWSACRGCSQRPHDTQNPSGLGRQTPKPGPKRLPKTRSDNPRLHRTSITHATGGLFSSLLDGDYHVTTAWLSDFIDSLSVWRNGITRDSHDSRYFRTNT